MEVTLLQTALKKQRTAADTAANSSEGDLQNTPDLATLRLNEDGNDDSHVLSFDHNGRVCMLCNMPLPERIGDRVYTEFRKDCGNRSTPTGLSADDMTIPAVQLWKEGQSTNGFCELNFAKSCADAVANEDYLYWPKSFDLEHRSMRSNVQWDSRYCHLNGFLEKSVVALQHNFTALRQKATELCSTKYAHRGIHKLSFLDMLQKSRHDDANAPSLDEAETLAAWNCAMGDLGCDMAMCAYSFCDKGEGETGLYRECEGWDPVKGMPF